MISEDIAKESIDKVLGGIRDLIYELDGKTFKEPYYQLLISIIGCKDVDIKRLKFFEERSIRNIKMLAGDLRLIIIEKEKGNKSKLFI